MIKTTIVIFVGLAGALPATAQLTGATTGTGCVSLGRGTPPVTAIGILALHTFPGSPGFKSVAAGDEAERTFILTLPRTACLDDHGELADPTQRFRTVQVYADDKPIDRRLRRLVGRRVVVTGEGMPANTGHHHAPLVLTARRVEPR